MLSSGLCLKAWDAHNSRIVAIKFIETKDKSNDAINSLLDEINFLRKLQYSPGVIKLYDWEHSNVSRHIYVVMESGDIDFSAYLDQLRNVNRLNALFIRSLWLQMLECVKAIHSEGIIHADLKPANFVLAKGLLKLIDFGIAKAIQPDLTSITQENLVGTVNYMSPERLNGCLTGKPACKLSKKSDVWSLGCILYSMIYHKTPFHHIKTIAEKIVAICNASIDYPLGMCEDAIPVLKMCLVCDTKKRASVDDLLRHPFVTR